jgi:hypothetical protein
MAVCRRLCKASLPRMAETHHWHSKGPLRRNRPMLSAVRILESVRGTISKNINVQQNKNGIMKSPSWRYSSSIYLPRKHCTVFRDDDLGVQLQVMAGRDRTFWRRRRKYQYFVDGVDRVFTSKVDLMRALERRNAGRTAPLHHQIHKWLLSALSLVGAQSTRL